MTTAHTTIHVDLDDETTVLYHCDQGRGRMSWRLNTEWGQTFYFTGTPLQLHEFGHRLMNVALVANGTSLHASEGAVG